MFYIKIPVKTKQEGVNLAEDHLGAMAWRHMEDGSLEAYPYDDKTPVILQQVAEPDTCHCADNQGEAQQEVEADAVFRCPQCNREWDTDKYNACQCGAVRHKQITRGNNEY